MATDHVADRTNGDQSEVTDQTHPAHAGDHASVVTAGTSEYVIRPFEPGDRADFLDLHETVFDGASREWFDWKFVDNPYVDETPIFVVAYDETVVGARPFLAFRMRAGDRTLTAFQTADTMVHPDHRRRGLFAEMTRLAFEYYADRDVAFTINVPNAVSRGGYLDLGCDRIGALSTHYRIQDPQAFVGDGRASRVARLAKPVVRGYLGFCGRFASPPPEVTVVRHRTVPASTLASLYRQRPPTAIHAFRDEQFFQYRFENPQWEYTTYTARLYGTPVAGIVTGTRTRDGTTETTLVDVVPLTPGVVRDRALEALLARILADHRDSAVVAVRGDAIPKRLLTTFGFLSDTSLPLSLAASPTVAITSPLPVDGEWRIAGRDLRDPENWTPTFAEHNTR